MGVQNEDLRANNDKLERGRKKMQQEFDDMNVELENSRSNLSALEKKQKKFDQVEPPRPSPPPSPSSPSPSSPSNLPSPSSPPSNNLLVDRPIPLPDEPLFDDDDDDDNDDGDDHRPEDFDPSIPAAANAAAAAAVAADIHKQQTILESDRKNNWAGLKAQMKGKIKPQSGNAPQLDAFRRWCLANGKKIRLDYEDEKESGVDVDAKTFLESRRPIVELQDEEVCCYTRKQSVKRFFMEEVRHGFWRQQGQQT